MDELYLLKSLRFHGLYRIKIKTLQHYWSFITSFFATNAPKMALESTEPERVDNFVDKSIELCPCLGLIRALYATQKRWRRAVNNGGLAPKARRLMLINPGGVLGRDE